LCGAANGSATKLPAGAGLVPRGIGWVIDRFQLSKGDTMNNVVEQFAEVNKATVAQATKIASLAIENAEKLARINVQGAKTALAQSVEGIQALMAAKDPQEFFALRARFAEAGAEAAIGYSKSLYDLGTEAQAQYAALVEDGWAAYTKNVAVWMENAGKVAPPGSDAAVNVFKSTFAASTAAIDQFSKATKQVVSLADASVRAAADNATKAAAPKGRKAA
jgi:phasin family protein